MAWAYLAGLAVGIAGLATIDWRYRLAFWRAPKQAAKTIACSMGIFIIWDFLGIALGVFRHGHSPYALPFVLLPEFPVEEIVFLFLLSYSALIIYTKGIAWRSRI